MKTSGKYIEYTGKNVLVAGHTLLENGKSYDAIMVDVANLLSAVSGEYDRIDVDPGYSGSASDKIGKDDAIKMMVRKISNLVTSSIRYDGDISDLTAGTVHSPSDFPNAHVKWSSSTTGTLVSFAYDLSALTQSLPSGFFLQNVRVSAQGFDTGGSSALRDTSDAVGVISIPLNRVPASVDFNVRASSDAGDLIFTTSVYVSSGAEVAEQLQPMGVKDLSRSVSASGGVDLNKVIQLLFSRQQTCINFIRQFETINIDGSTGVFSTLSTCKAQISKCFDRIDDLEKSSYVDSESCDAKNA